MKQNETSKNTAKTVNKSGYAAFKLDPKISLITKVLTTFFNEPKYYGDNSLDIIVEATKMADDDPKFLAGLTKYARREFHMRTVTHILTAIMSYISNSKPYVKETVPYVVERPDDIIEILSSYLKLYHGNTSIKNNTFTIPNSLKKSLAKAFDNFNEYQLSKYNGQNKTMKLGDAIKLVHPKRKDIYKKVIENTLETATRWETEVSTKGNNNETWTSLLDNNKIGYMALLRNLSNILNSKLDKDHMDKVYSILSDEEKVLNSKQLPFRFYSAYKMLLSNPNCTSKTIDVLNTALQISIKSLIDKPLSGKTLIAIDISGSMCTPISKHSSVLCNEIAATLGVISNKICEESIFMSFDTRYKIIPLSTKGNMLEQIQKTSSYGGGTDITLPLKYAIDNNILFDRIIILSDNEINSSSIYGIYDSSTVRVQSLLNKYRNNINKNVYYYGIDLVGYGTSCVIPDEHTAILAGWSEKILQFIQLFEIDKQSLIKTIENYK